MLSHRYLRSTYGSASAFSEYQPGDTISYLEHGREQSGTILWICAPTTLGNRYLGMTYVVQSLSSRQPVRVSPANVLIVSEKVPE